MDSSKFIFVILFNFIYFTSFSQASYIAEINRTTGNSTVTGPPILGVTFGLTNVRAYDENNGLFIFIAATPTYNLYSIDVSNEAIISNPLCTSLISEIEYCNSMQTLYGLYHSDSVYFVSIDINTGISTTIGNSIPVSGTYQGMSAFNQKNNIYICYLPPNNLYSIDVTNGNILSNPALVLPQSGDIIVNIAYDDSTNTLYGLLSENYNQIFYLISINTTTGVCTKIGTGTTFGQGNGTAAIDQVNQQYIYIYSNNDMTSLDIPTGNLIFHKVLTHYSSQGNHSNLKYDNIHKKLYSNYWDSIPESIESLDKLPDAAMLGNAQPNPNNGSAQIPYYVPENTIEAKIIFTDMLGKVMEEKPLQTGYGMLNIDTHNLPNGTYSYSLIIDGVIKDTKKMIVIK